MQQSAVLGMATILCSIGALAVSARVPTVAAQTYPTTAAAAQQRFDAIATAAVPDQAVQVTNADGGDIVRVTANADWTPTVQDFDGVPMALVPAGCFMMGMSDAEIGELTQQFGDYDEFHAFGPQHQQCFDEPFWIDQTEVTQVTFERLGGVQTRASHFRGDRRPVENITWFEARDFCALRGARLPTEREWEYAARGPDGLVYPWGNAWNPDYAIWGMNSDGETAFVGTLAAGASWVGALDMSGNVFEWVSTIYGIDDGDYDFTEPGEFRYLYPYQVDDGREDDAEDRTSIRVLRGGSWINNIFDNLRADTRLRVIPDDRYQIYGFRCARDY